MPKSYALDSPQSFRIIPGKRSTYIDDHIRFKRGIPQTLYNTATNLLNEKLKSSLPKEKRRLVTDDILAHLKLNPSPAPVAYSPNHRLLQQNEKVCFV